MGVDESGDGGPVRETEVKTRLLDEGLIKCSVTTVTTSVAQGIAVHRFGQGWEEAP